MCLSRVSVAGLTTERHQKKVPVYYLQSAELGDRQPELTQVKRELVTSPVSGVCSSTYKSATPLLSRLTPQALRLPTAYYSSQIVSRK
ncbi:hypothetical protein NDU88_002272 [Pleurodeles waltl]|uniref:Uncharacterized protein n=1 Tax=Pleurodeles waltl TaxID=8319 RepID=A0AAV7VDC4_PLEWA|nr:hypothetical protein NDU88_002272 [Pleurodeles waltl]